LCISLVSHKSNWFKSDYTSSTEAENGSLYLATTTAIWLKKIADTFNLNNKSPIEIFEDNQGAIKYNHSKARAGRMKHIDVNAEMRIQTEDRSIMV
jgi:hypothetical protein